MTKAWTSFAGAAALMLLASASARAAEPLDEARIIPLAEWDYGGLYAEGWSAEDLMDARVIGAAGREIGEIENILIGEDGKIVALIAEIGGFLDIGDTHVAVPWQEVDIGAGLEFVSLPIGEDNIEDYGLYREDEFFSVADARFDETEVVSETLRTGPRIWRVDELIDDPVFLEGGIGYGHVEDVIFSRDGEVRAVIVDPAIERFGGPYAYPFYGYAHGWHPGLDHYELPYREDEVAELAPYDHEAMDEGLFGSAAMPR